MKHREFYGHIGPFSLLIIGSVWGFDAWRWRVYGDGWRVRFGTVRK